MFYVYIIFGHTCYGLRVMSTPYDIHFDKDLTQIIINKLQNNEISFNLKF